MKNKQFNRNLFIIVTMIIIFAFGYYLYIDVYSRSKEDHIIATKSRILERMSQNLKMKVSSMGNNANEYVDHLLDLSQNDKDNFISLLEQKKDKDNFNTDLEYANYSEPESESLKGNNTVTKVKPKAEYDFLYFRLALGNKFGGNKNKIIAFKTRYDSLMSSIMQRNIFNEYILIVEDTVIYSTLPGKPTLAFNEKGNVQAKGEESGSEKAIPVGNIELATRSKIEQATIRGVTAYDISISNNQYKLFICQMQVDNKTWQLCGLVNTELINQAKKGTAPWILILVLMILALIILGLPFIKLKVMSHTEQLTSGNLLNASISLFLGSCFVYLFIFFVSDANWYQNQNKDRLKDLATEINDLLNTEIKNAWSQLVLYDKIGINETNIKNPLPEGTSVLDNKRLYPVSYPYFDYAFWMDTTGYQMGILTPFTVRDNPTKLPNRDYFKKPDEWMLPGNSDERFRMESIVSVTSGVVKVALSKKSEIKNMVIAMTARFYSIIEPILPKDFKFCIIDGNGKVWFHSDKSRNLQENFITESNWDKSLSAAIYANTATTLEVNYYDEPYRIYIKPLAPMPLYLVTMYDKQAEYAYQVQGLMLTLLLFSSLILFIIIETLLLFLSKRFGRKPGWKNLIVDFIGAREEHTMIYLIMSVLLVLVAILYFSLTDTINILDPLINALVMVLFLFPYTNYVLNDFSFKSLSRNIFASISMVFLIMINISSIGFLSNYDLSRMMIFQGALIALLVAGYFVIRNNFFLKLKNQTIPFYVSFLMGLLLVFSVAPSIKFFEASVNHEVIRGLKHDQLELARQRESRNKQLRSYYKLMEQNHKLDSMVVPIYERRMNRGIYSKFVGSIFYIQDKSTGKEKDNDINNIIKKNKIRDNQRGEKMINLFRPVYDRTSVETKYLGNDSLLNGNQIWSFYKNSLVFDYYSTTEKYENQKPIHCSIYTNFEHPGIFNPLGREKETYKWSLFQKYDIIFILFLMFVFYGIYQLVLFGTRRMFGIPILEMHTDFNFGNFLCERIATGESVMVIGTPSVNPISYVREQLQVNFNLMSVDFSKPEDVIANEKSASDKDVLIIENFGFDFYSSASLLLQVNKVIEKIRQNERIVIISIKSPYAIQDYLEQKAKQKGDEKDKPDAAIETWEQLKLSFKYIISNVNILYTPEKYDQNIPQLSCYSGSECERILSDYTGDYDKYMRCLICRELAVSTYLHRYSVEIMKFYDQLKMMELPEQIIIDRIIARIMDLSRLHYDNILDSCTPMERFVLSDMAQDMIVNSKNKKVVNLLIHRGLLVANECSIRFMNESFRKHVLLRFTSEEKARLKEKIGDVGISWQDYKLILILVMIGLFTFLFIANRAILDNLNKLFIVLGGGTVLITNLTGLFTRKETGNPK